MKTAPFVCRNPEVIGGIPVFCGTLVPLLTLLDHLEVRGRDIVDHEGHDGSPDGMGVDRERRTAGACGRAFDVVVKLDFPLGRTRKQRRSP